MQFQHRPGTVAHTSEVIYPPIALRGLEAWATSGDQRDTGSHVNLARTVTVGLVRGIWRSHVDRIHAVLAFDGDLGIALANDRRACAISTQPHAIDATLSVWTQSARSRRGSRA